MPQDLVLLLLWHVFDLWPLEVLHTLDAAKKKKKERNVHYHKNIPYIKDIYLAYFKQCISFSSLYLCFINEKIKV